MIRVVFLVGVLGLITSVRADTVILMGAVDTGLKSVMETNLSRMLSEMETADVSKVSDILTPNGIAAYERLMSKVTIRNGRAVHESRCLQLPSQLGYEVRDIRVQVELGNTEGSPYQNLVFSLNPEGLIEDVRFALEKKNYEAVMREGVQLEDYVQRQHILQTVEFFRTAYNRRDIKYIERIFSDDALIIVGNVITERPDLPSQEGMLSNSFLEQNQISFLLRSKEQYLEGLRGVFGNNDFLRVSFDSLKVVRDSQDPALYGISLKQKWRSSSYSDTGYVFLLMDFEDIDKPLIHVRSWQPERFEDGSMITLQDFEIIRVE